MADLDSIKLCECGCGQQAPIRTYTARRRGLIAGQPARFIHGHGGRKRWTCSVEGCAEEHAGNGLCDKHWHRQNKHGDPHRVATRSEYVLTGQQHPSYKHGCESHPLYPVWAGIMRRCYNAKSNSFKNYGGRGIKVCDRWHDVRNFIADVGRRPSAAHSIDRYPNNDGDYEPGNVRWATRSQQAYNRRRA